LVCNIDLRLTECLLLAFLSRAEVCEGKGWVAGRKASAALWQSALSSPYTPPVPPERQRKG